MLRLAGKGETGGVKGFVELEDKVFAYDKAVTEQLAQTLRPQAEAASA